MQRKIPLFLLMCVALFVTPFSASASDSFDHSPWSTILAKYVDERGMVDYQGLHADRQEFDAYIASIESVSPISHPDQFQDQADELAFYINAYNAQVFRGVLNRGPEQKSVWRGLISGYNFFVKMKIKVGGETTNLKKLEDDIIRARYKDPRIHAAINCASISCPRLIQNAFTAAELDTQLDQVMREFVNSELHVQLDSNTNSVKVSKIFDWFKEDFLNYETSEGNLSPTLLDYINRYRDTEIPEEYKLGFLKYDKGINDQ